jgi:hypothetical protein
MATKEEMTGKYLSQLNDINVEVDMPLLEWAIDRVGPANYNADGQTVAASDEAELKTVYTNFVADELAEADEAKGMAAIHEVAEQMKGESRKFRAVFYYLLAKQYGK